MLHFLFKTTQLMHSALPLMNIDVIVVYSMSDIIYLDVFSSKIEKKRI